MIFFRNKNSKSSHSNIRNLVTRMLAFASLRWRPGNAITICIASPGDSNDYVEARERLCKAVAKEYIAANGGSVYLLKILPERGAEWAVTDDGGDSSVTFSNIEYVELAMRSREQPLADDIYTDYSLIVVDAGAVESSAPLFWKESADVITLIVDSTVTTDIALERLRKEIDLLGMRIDAAVLINFPLYIPQYIYDRL